MKYLFEEAVTLLIKGTALSFTCKRYKKALLFKICKNMHN